MVENTEPKRELEPEEPLSVQKTISKILIASGFRHLKASLFIKLLDYKTAQLFFIRLSLTMIALQTVEYSLPEKH